MVLESLALLLGILIAVGGWIANAVHSRREKRREVRIQYLLEAYRNLDDAVHRNDPLTDERADSFERAIADIQLLGNGSQVALADKFCREFASGDGADPGDLLEALRIDLRSELLLPDAEPRTTWMRLTR